MSTTARYILGTQSTLVSGANLQALASNSLVAGTAWDNTQGQTGDGYIRCDVEAKLVFVSAPPDATGISVWLLGTQDGTVYEDGSSTITPARNADFVIPLKNANGTTQIVNRRLMLPAGKFTPLAKNDGTGVAIANNTSSYIKIRPVTYQSV